MSALLLQLFKFIAEGTLEVLPSFLRSILVENVISIYGLVVSWIDLIVMLIDHLEGCVFILVGDICAHIALIEALFLKRNLVGWF